MHKSIKGAVYSRRLKQNKLLTLIKQKVKASICKLFDNFFLTYPYSVQSSRSGWVLTLNEQRRLCLFLVESLLESQLPRR